jgi:hypothetical protein
VLRRHCEREGRDYDAIVKTCAFRFDVAANGSKLSELLGQLRWLAHLGIQRVVGSVSGVERVTPLETIGREVIPAAASF